MQLLNGAPAPTLCDPTPSPEDIRVTPEAVRNLSIGMRHVVHVISDSPPVV